MWSGAHVGSYWARWSGEGCLGKPGATESVLLFFLVNKCGRNKEEDRGAYARLESAGLVVGPRVTERVLVMATRELVAISEVVIWRYQPPCALHLAKLCTRIHTIWPTLPCHFSYSKPAPETWSSQMPRNGPSVS